jgi:hypothetical protein
MPYPAENGRMAPELEVPVGDRGVPSEPLSISMAVLGSEVDNCSGSIKSCGPFGVALAVELTVVLLAVAAVPILRLPKGHQRRRFPLLRLAALPALPPPAPAPPL